MSKKPLSVEIEGNELVIRIGLDTLAVAVEYDPQLQVYDDDLDEYFGPKVTNESKWAKEIVHALNSEEEGGTTLVHLMLDNAAMQALESGAEGILSAGEVRDKARTTKLNAIGGGK